MNGWWLATGMAALMLGGCKNKDDGDGPGATDPVQEQVDAWLRDMTLEEKVEQMHGSQVVEGLWLTAHNSRLQIPGFAMSDGPRGVTAGTSTTFPVAIARGASWDPSLERRIAEVVGKELSAKGGNVILAPAMNLLRHPGWGRAQETYGEDTHHMTEFAVAYVEGAQEHVISTPKHFAVNSIEDTRFDVDITVDDRTLRELYLPHFEATAAAGAGAFMSAYNSVNGAFCAENKTLLTDILKIEWGFEGFVMSDWIWGTHDTVGAANAGLDVEMPVPQFYGQPLVDAVRAGDVPERQIDDAVRRILRAKLVFGLDDPAEVPADVVESPEHVALALEAALASMVLLKNEDALPLEAVNTVAVLGPLADVANLGDAGSSNATPSYAIDPLTGIEAAASAHGVGIVHTTDPGAAAFTDAAIVVVGLTSDDEGEQIPLFPGGDRDTLGLDPADITLIEEVAGWSERVVVVLEGGSAITVEPWIDSVEGLVMAWYPGMEGGTALGQLLFGDANFEGRLPLSIPVALEDLPPFDHVSHAVTYEYLHGYRHLDANATAARFPFGFGLSYTEFSYSDLSLSSTSVGADATLEAQITLRNDGSEAGAEVVQAYVSGAPGAAPRDLRAFQKVWLQPGEQQTVTLEIPVSSLRHWDDGWTLTTDYQLEVGPHHADLPLSAEFSVTP